MKEKESRELVEDDRHYRHFMDKIRLRKQQNSSVFLEHYAHSTTSPPQVTVGDDSRIKIVQASYLASCETGQPPQIPKSTVTKPVASTSRLQMLDCHGCVTTDPSKCYMWTRQQPGYGWWSTPANPPPLR
jgi:hypothetical protein